ncbi:LysR family transcriptional regulator [Edaphovirga cremea]|uniref:LysR family transcriptional regulator n=1 Tax=Edaphovirga cremea TaxID=2267246 RepID=UPI0014762CEC|nr:LysR family transcriptional regulator [Edaphovirga cremea]
MNLTRLRTFLVLTECLNFSEAAEILYCSQPTVSIQIRTLEEEIGCTLFDRVGKKLYVNQQGNEFKIYATQMLNIWAAAKENALRSRSGEYGLLSFGASNFVGIYLLPILLSTFKKKHTKIKINMQIRSSATLLGLLEKNEVDFLILSDQVKINETIYQKKDFYRDRLILVAPSEHPLAQVTLLDLSQLEGCVLLWKPENSSTRIFLEQLLKNNNVSIKNHIEISSLEAIKQSVINSLGIAFISESAVKQELNHGLLTEVFTPQLNIKRGVVYVTRRDKILTPVASNFIKLLESINHKNDIQQALLNWSLQSIPGEKKCIQSAVTS